MGSRARPYLPPDFTDSCVVPIGEDGKAIGFLTYDCGRESWDITLSYVDPEHRRKHIHTALFNALRDKAKEQGNVVSITCVTHATRRKPHSWPEQQTVTNGHWVRLSPRRFRLGHQAPEANRTHFMLGTSR